MSYRRFDFARLKARVSIPQVLAAYGRQGNLRRRGRYLIGPCPLHGGDNPTAFRVHLDRGLWRCFTACGGGDVVELVRVIERCSFARAARSLDHIDGHHHPDTTTLLGATRADSPRFRPFTRRLPLNPCASFLQQAKRITVSTAIRFETGIAQRSILLRGTVAVRLHDPVGRPLGYCGRRLADDDIERWGKWRFARGFPKSEVLYNAHRAAEARQDGIVVVECPWGVMRLHQAGVRNAVALLGTILTAVHAQWLAAAPEVLLLLDGDEPGRRAARMIAPQLSATSTVHIHDLDDNVDPDDLSDSRLRQLVRRYLPSP